MYQTSNAKLTSTIPNTSYPDYDTNATATSTTTTTLNTPQPSTRNFDFTTNHNGIYQNNQQFSLPQQTNQIPPVEQYQIDNLQVTRGLESGPLNRIYEDNDAISFGLDEIGAIINSKDFLDLTESKPQQQIPLQNQAAHQDPPQQQHQNKTEDKFQALNVIKLDGDYYPQFNNNQEENIEFYDNNTLDTNQHNTMDMNNYNESLTNNMSGAKSSQNNKFIAQDNNKTPKPYVEIIEQPAKCSLRFRYKCEGRSAGSLPGVNSTVDTKTYPSIKIHNYIGRAVVVISCVTKDPPYRAHPHNIVGKDGCKKGICTIVINNETDMVRSFQSLGIQCVKRKEIEESLTLRESINVDPYRNGFAHKYCASNIDLNVVRLCFQVFIEGSTPKKCDIPLIPVVTEPIHDKKAMSDLVITKLSHCSAPATGGREVILLCDRISKDDIQIRFYEERDGELIWETYSDLSPADVHKQVAICFKTPKYHDENITQPVMARIQLKRVSDNQFSEPRLFQFLPCESDEDIISRKRQKIQWVNYNLV